MLNDVSKRVLAYDATTIIAEGIENKILNPKLRYQSYLTAENFFKAPKGICLCGCNKEVPTKRHKWATPQCAHFVYDVLNIIRGVRETLLRYLTEMHGAACSNCGLMYCDFEVDHIKAVMHGGGASWLNNFALLCKSCHKEKTKKDMNKNNVADFQ